MTGPVRLAGLADVYLDTSAVLAAIMPGSPDAHAAAEFCTRLAVQGGRVYFSQTLLLELSQAIRKIATRRDRVAPGLREEFALDRWERDLLVRRRWMRYGVEQFAQLRSRFAEVIELPFDTGIWERSIDLMVEHFLQAHDAVHAATAAAYGLRAFATTDADFARVDPPDVILLRGAAESS